MAIKHDNDGEVNDAPSKRAKITTPSSSNPSFDHESNNENVRSKRAKTISSSPAIEPSSNPNHSKRLHDYRCAIFKLNFQLVILARRALSDPSSIPSTGPYFNLVSHYIHQIELLKQTHLKIYGDAAVFGSGDCGQLGCGQGVSDSRLPRIVMGLRGFKIGSISCGGLHTLALGEGGLVFAFGCNDEGSLGAKPKNEGYLPCTVLGFVPSAYGVGREGLEKNLTFMTRRERLGEANVVKVSAGETTSLALSDEGDVYVWGSYRDNEGRKFRNMPPKDDDRIPTGYKDMTTLEDDENPSYYHPPRGNQDWPMHLILPQKAKDISSGEGYAAAILEDDTIVTWGVVDKGQLGRPVPKLDKKTSNKMICEEFMMPKPPLWADGGLNARHVMAVSCGSFHLLVVVRENGTNVYSCGLNSNYGQLGLGDAVDRHELTKVQFFENRDIFTVEGGYHHSCFLDITRKKLYVCGRGDYGQLGITIERPNVGYFESTPVRVPLCYKANVAKIPDLKVNCIIKEDIVKEDQPEIKQISCGSYHNIVLTKSGDVYSWGFGEMGVCGQGQSIEDVCRPTKINATLKNAQGTKYGVSFVNGGGQHSAMVVSTESTGFVSEVQDVVNGRHDFESLRLS